MDIMNAYKIKIRGFFIFKNKSVNDFNIRCVFYIIPK